MSVNGSGQSARPTGGIWQCLLWGAVCTAFYVLLLLLFAYLSFRMEWPGTFYFPAGTALAALCALLSGLFCAKGGKQKRLLRALLSGAVAAVLSSAAVFLLGGRKFGFGLLLLCGVLLLASAAGGILTLRGSQRRTGR